MYIKEKTMKRSSEVSDDDSEANSKRVYTLEARLSDIEDSVMCLVCLNIPREVPVPSCGSGHIICQACRWKTSSCPKCKQKIDGHSLLAETLIAKLEHRCKFKAQGCQVKMLLEDLKTHESNCPDNPDEKLIKINFKGFKGKRKTEVFLFLKVITPMRDLKNSYSKTVGVPVADLRFMFLNLRVNDDETPKILNMMEEDIIQVFNKRNGCSADEAMYDIVDRITASDSNRLFPMLKVVDTSDHPVTLSCCPQGHIVFQVYWRPRLTSCNTCRAKLLPILQSASILENVLHQCKFSYNGCSVKMRPKFLEIHEAQCIHRGKFSVDKEIIRIKLVESISQQTDSPTDTEVHYRVKMTKRMMGLKKLHCSQMGFSLTDLRWTFDGRICADDDSPMSLKIENGDEVDIFMSSSGS